MKVKQKQPVGFIINEVGATISKPEIVDRMGRRIMAKGVVQEAEEKNRNGRWYSNKDLAREIKAPRQKELLSTKNMKGEAGHPITTDLGRQQTIDPKCTCVRFLEFWMEGNKVLAKFQGDNSQLGEAFDLDLREGVFPAFSLRALGTIEETAKGALVTNLKMITYDYVIYPSHPGAYTTEILSEAVMMEYRNKSKLYNKLRNNKNVNIDGTKAILQEFTNQQALMLMKMNENGAVDYIMDKSKNFSLIKEFYELSNNVTVDLTPDGKITINEAGQGKIVMYVDDYIQKEIMEYTRF